MIDVYVSNPFATKFVNAGRLDFVGLGDDQLDHLAKTLIQQNGNGQIVGRHGVGKTTLTFELEERVTSLCDSEMAYRFVRKTIGQRGTVRSGTDFKQSVFVERPSGDGFLNGTSIQTSRPAKTVLVIDGVERLSWLKRLALIKSCKQKRIGLLLTSHRRIWGVPTLIELKSDFKRFEAVFQTLTTSLEFQLSSDQLREIFADSDGNMREALMSCYDEFEASRARTDC